MSRSHLGGHRRPFVPGGSGSLDRSRRSSFRALDSDNALAGFAESNSIGTVVPFWRFSRRGLGEREVPWRRVDDDGVRLDDARCVARGDDRRGGDVCRR